MGKNNEDICNFIETANNLVKYGEHCAEMVRQQKLEKPEAQKELKRAHPGLGEETDLLALKHGFLLTR